MTILKRIIPRLDVKGPNLVKGICLEGFRVLGTPPTFARLYDAAGADEVLYVDSVASLYQRPPGFDEIRRTAAELTIPMTVVGGIGSIENIRLALAAGADKVGINTAAIRNPRLLRQAVEMFGSQCIVASIEAFRHKDGRYEAWVDYGRERTGIDVFQWVDKVVEMGVGEILVTSVNHEGMGDGFDVDLVRRIARAVPVPVVAAGGAGCLEHFVDVAVEGEVEAIAAASVFHYHYARPFPDRLWMSYDKAELRLGSTIDSGNIQFLNDGYGGFREIPVTPLTIGEVKRALLAEGVAVRPPSAAT